ncbi:YwdI family protein [Mesobacillus maritimus]|uniref:YwdI family protein n=1 Tax=Mesobacillus maritimus TaxID=1643336 RepID=UPI0020401534|nr:YwdI family protein [Mesobacillus maritimus]MCM3586820.1 YwdI family protein [Mesobacillus maritimus]MCM3668825.1 YwdI family protein [Mesobacillus maritimus]
MNISLQKLLRKMDDELRSAQNAESEAAVRERIHSLKTLCELVLDEPKGQSVPKPKQQPTLEKTVPFPTQPQSQVALQTGMYATQPQNQTKRIEMEDGANGDSLFDF